MNIRDQAIRSWLDQLQGSNQGSNFRSWEAPSAEGDQTRLVLPSLMTNVYTFASKQASKVIVSLVWNPTTASAVQWAATAGQVSSAPWS